MAQYLGVSQIETDSVSVTGGVCGPGVDSANTHLTFDLPLRTSIVPKYCRGSGTPTFTRASNAYVADHEGILRLAKSGEARFWGARRVANVLMTDPNNSNWSSWATLNVSITTGIADPSGGTDACRVTATGAGAAFKALGGNGILNTTRFCCSSIWIRRVSGVGAIQLEAPDDTGIVITGAITTDWQRFAATGMSPGGNAYVGINVMATSGDVIDVWRPQIEDITGASNQAPSEWVGFSTWGPGSAPYHGAGVDGVKYFDTTNGNSVNSNVVTEATGMAVATTREGVYPATLWQQGYLCEPQITNRVLYSEDFSNAAWVKTNVTVTANSAAAPDGATTADTLTASAGNGTVIQDLGVVASAKKTGSLWIKRKTGSGNIQLTLDGGSTWTTVSVTASWTRFELTQTLANEDFGIRIVTSGDAVYAWGGQIEQANGSSSLSWMSTYVPTTSAAVQRDGDNLTFPTTGNISLAAGTVAARVTLDGVARWSERVVELGGGDWSPLTQNGLVSIYDGVSSVFTPPSNVDIRAAAVWRVGGNKQAFGNNLQSVANAFNGTLIGATIQVNGSGTDLAGSKPIRDIRIWSAVMPILTDGTVASQISG